FLRVSIAVLCLDGRAIAGDGFVKEFFLLSAASMMMYGSWSANRRQRFYTRAKGSSVMLVFGFGFGLDKRILPIAMFLALLRCSEKVSLLLRIIPRYSIMSLQSTSVPATEITVPTTVIFRCGSKEF
ncbi:hypothetical protein Trydic_g18447, partial [Trypoxylus dichotomus]